MTYSIFSPSLPPPWTLISSLSSAKFVIICSFVLTNASLVVLLYQLSTRMREQARLVSMALAHMSAVASSGHRVPFMTHAFVVSSSCE